MQWGEYMVQIFDSKTEKNGDFFTGSKSDCCVWKMGAEAALKAVGNKNILIRTIKIKKGNLK